MIISVVFCNIVSTDVLRKEFAIRKNKNNNNNILTIKEHPTSCRHVTRVLEVEHVRNVILVRLIKTLDYINCSFPPTRKKKCVSPRDFPRE